jgi:hypothetical protein
LCAPQHFALHVVDGVLLFEYHKGAMGGCVAGADGHKEHLQALLLGLVSEKHRAESAVSVAMQWREVAVRAMREAATASATPLVQTSPSYDALAQRLAALESMLAATTPPAPAPAPVPAPAPAAPAPVPMRAPAALLGMQRERERHGDRERERERERDRERDCDRDRDRDRTLCGKSHGARARRDPDAADRGCAHLFRLPSWHVLQSVRFLCGGLKDDCRSSLGKGLLTALQVRELLEHLQSALVDKSHWRSVASLENPRVVWCPLDSVMDAAVYPTVGAASVRVYVDCNPKPLNGRHLSVPGINGYKDAVRRFLVASVVQARTVLIPDRLKDDRLLPLLEVRREDRGRCPRTSPAGFVFGFLTVPSLHVSCGPLQCLRPSWPVAAHALDGPRCLRA